ncbi:DUF1127 domain-containing protein [Azospirillum sp. YIM DDC1]|uniref:DUF1127 domain-containing protein n=1 Tax=Azospirillum aestuarii TaxID=2802052 RepID=A0ABS1HSY0_9PROT|nr:DUF1127 domain-containing protein [Azospirillum aestuarii]MBK3775192.1 DUF1127 domain-containing protein [Azospirillum brasilense]MBK4717443.1 DUF1127 domain-containing protein [Azospirillum aestuarii]TWA93405.1 uncharacterized protein YjiS (DUF1127 family) [Azospirillum brasilense]
MAQSMNDGMNGSMNTRTDAQDRPGQGIGGAVVALFDTVATWNERRRQRRALEALPDHLLQDIGLSRADAVTEADKPFWQG